MTTTSTTNMYYSNHSFLVILCLCLCLTERLLVVNALPSGAANCVGGKAAVGVAHLEGNVTDGTLDKGGIVVSIDNHILTPGITTVLPKGRALTWSLNATKRPFRGFLVRAEDLTIDFETAVDTTESLSPLAQADDDDDHVQVASTVCINAYRVGGVTHKNNNQKGFVSGLFRMDEAVEELQLDVTVVVKNRGGNSVFFYSGFVVSVQEDGNNNNNNNGNEDEDEEEDDVETENQDGDKDKIDTLEETDSPLEEDSETESPLTDEEPTKTPTEDTEEENEATDSSLQDNNQKPQQQQQQEATTNNNEELGTGEGGNNDDGLPLILRASSCSDESPCAQCEGDCNKNSQCQDGLECFYRPDTTPIPGCIGDGVAGTDYCYMPRNDTLRLRSVDCSADSPCDACQGTCMTDADCEGDDLFCFLRPDSTPVPGCIGDGVTGRNYCFYSNTNNATDTNDEASWPTRAPSPPTPLPTPPRPPSPNPPSMSPTAAPTKPISTESPTPKPTRRPRPTDEPTMSPTEPAPTPKTTRRPRPERLTDSPTVYPTVMPTQEPTLAPTSEPTSAVTTETTYLAKQEPTLAPTSEPTSAVTTETTYVATQEPTFVPTLKPTLVPTVSTPSPTNARENTQRPSLRATFVDAFGANNEDNKNKDKDTIENDDNNEDDIDQSNISNNGQGDISNNDENNSDVNVNGGNKALSTREEGCSENNPCNECEGDCNSDNDCLGTLQCFQRPDQTRVPGCNGLGVSGTDYCAVNPNPARPTELPPASPRPPTPMPTPQRAPPTIQPFQDDLNEDDTNNVILDNIGKTLEDRNRRPCSQQDPCRECFGDCNSDEDCEGQLQCYFRSDFEPVPGCAGQGSRGTDYCAYDMSSLNTNTNNNDNNNINNNDNTIINGGGDNNNNDSNNDIVTNPGGSNLLNTRTAACTPSNPCGECQGDCDGDNDCAGILQCFFRVENEEVPGCLGSGVSGRDYCALNPQFQNRQRGRMLRSGSDYPGWRIHY